MSDCCEHCVPDKPPAGYIRVLWWALGINAAMFFVEVTAGIGASSVALLADAVDFLGDAGNYGLSLAVIALGALWRSRTALFKGACMGAFGLFVIAQAAWNFLHDASPEPLTMGAIGVLALAANLWVAFMLYRFREGDADMRSVWLCTRNDAIGNIAVIIAALGVFGTGTAYPDLIVAAVMAALALSAAVSVIRHARSEVAAQLAA